MLFAIDLLVRHPGEDFIDEKGTAVASVFSLQPSSVYSTKFDTPKSNCFAADSDASLCQKIFYEWSGIPAVTEVETEVEPDGIRNDIWRESVASISIHAGIVSKTKLIWQHL
jgi:hypothetical protein